MGTIRLRVGDILQQRKMTTKAFADAAGLSYNTALAVRRGSSNRIDLDTLARICDALGIKPASLFEYTPGDE